MKWKKEEPRISNGHPIATKLTFFPDVYQPKLLRKAPSMRVIQNYNNISTAEDSSDCSDKLWFIGDPEDEKKRQRLESMDNLRNYEIGRMSGRIFTSQEDFHDYATMTSKGSLSNTAISSEIDVSRDDLGSTARLVSPKMQTSCKTFLSFVETALCTTSLAAGVGNLYRLPQAVVTNGGLPFFVAYLILMVIVGFPVLFLEMGIGQIVQEGFIKTWRAVPFFKGIGYIKLIAGFLLLIYYPLYMGLSLYYLIWFAKSPPPFVDCAIVKMAKDGYKANGYSGQECIKKTFLVSPFTDPQWFGIYATLILLIWFITLAWCIKRTKSYEKALVVFCLCTAACLIALIVKAIDANQAIGIENFGTKANWDILKNGEVWYYAAIQMFFSTHIGFGVFSTNAGIIYKKSNPLWTSFGYILLNMVLGTMAVLIFYTVTQNMDPVPKNGTIFEIHLLTHIYDVVLQSEDANMQVWSVVAYITILFTGFISMITILYTVIKAISLETKNKLRWWQLNLILSFLGFVFGCLTLMVPNFDVVHLFDHYIVGNLIIISVILEISAFMIFYRPGKVQLDLEFMLGYNLSNIWIGLWCVAPGILLGVFVWGLVSMSLTGQSKEDEVWIYSTGWSVVLGAFIFIILVGFYVIGKQEEYFTVIDKFKASLKPSRKWGPTDPMLLHRWVQWQSRAQEGERDFTLKRRGTTEYTHSVKNRSKYTPTVSDSSTLSRTLNLKQHHPENYSEPYYSRSTYEKPLRVTSLVDAIDTTPINTFQRGYKTNHNPLAYINNVNVNGYQEGGNDGSTSEGYGTYRKGPYVIEDGGLEHVCHRKASYNEQATEL